MNGERLGPAIDGKQEQEVSASEQAGCDNGQFEIVASDWWLVTSWPEAFNPYGQVDSHGREAGVPSKLAKGVAKVVVHRGSGLVVRVLTNLESRIPSNGFTHFATPPSDRLSQLCARECSWPGMPLGP
jgi:hypothetical protein